MSFQDNSYLVGCGMHMIGPHLLLTDCPNSAAGLWSGQGFGKEQGRAQGLTLSAGSQRVTSFSYPESVTQPSPQPQAMVIPSLESLTEKKSGV